MNRQECETEGFRGRVTGSTRLAFAVSAALVAAQMAHAQGQNAEVLEEVTVTAQKRTQNLQDVPISIQALGTQKLQELHIKNLDDYMKFLPGVSYNRGQGGGGGGGSGQPGTARVYMRGVASGGDSHLAGSQPSVGVYLDEQPVTTIEGALDVHVYDIARVEVLAGPQGTLYGASSQAGTIRIITNKPDPNAFEAGYDVSVDSVAHGGTGYTGEGFVNLPISKNAAVRLVGWYDHDAGYINNVAGTNVSAGIVDGLREFPTWSAARGGGVGAGSISNAADVKSRYNTADIRGGRAALRIDLGDNWTITPTVMAQSVESDGFFAYDPDVGEREVVKFGPEKGHDSWTQSALTVEGKVSDFDIVYAGAYMKRDKSGVADYSDYTFFYDNLFGSGAYLLGDDGSPIMPQQTLHDNRDYSKWSHELRVSTPQDFAVKGTLGLFAQRQEVNIGGQYKVEGYNGMGLAQNLSVPGYPNTLWLTTLQRVDRDSAAFGEVTWDIDPHWSATAGIRFYKSKNSLEGFFGFSANFQEFSGFGSGMLRCGPPGGPRDITYAPFRGAPCTSMDATVEESGNTPRFNLTYKFDSDRLVYATYSEGFRPGGVNRSFNSPPYKADYLTNYEIGWKTQWLDRRLRWNGAIFWEDWDNFQFAFLGGSNSVTIIANGGSARIRGIESDLQWALGSHWMLSAGFSLLKPELSSNYCGSVDDNLDPITNCPNQQNSFDDGTTTFGPLASEGTTLPITPKFKANAVARYSFELSSWDANVQAALVYQSKSSPALRDIDRRHLGELGAFSLFDLSAGLQKNGMSFELVVTNVFDKLADLARFGQCLPEICTQTYVVPTQPRTVALRFGQRF